MFKVFKTGVVAATHNAGTGADNQRKTAMEADTISKHGRSSKSQMSRGNFFGTFCFKGVSTFLLVAVSSANFAYGQINIAGKEGHIGIRAGANFTKISGDIDVLEDEKFKPGIQFGAVVNLPMKNEKLLFQTGLIFAQLGGMWEESDSETYMGETFEYDAVAKITLNYFQVPANFLYQHSLNNGNILLLQAGPYLGYGLGGKFKLDVTASSMGETESESEEETINFGSNKNKHHFKTFDLGLGFGVGLLFKDKFHVGLGYNIGLADVRQF